MCEQATVTDVNRKTYTVTVQTKHSNKDQRDVQVLAPYHHYANGEGIHHLPEVGAQCYLAFPSDNTPPFIMGYVAPPRVLNSSDGDPERSTMAAGGSSTDVSYQSKRPDFNPGDIGITTRDENFLFLRRGGVLQIGATGIAQRVYVPVLNYIKDFCENYAMHTFGGDLEWTVARPEKDPKGKAAASWVFHLHEFAGDKMATVRVRHLPLSSGADKKAAWEIQVAPQGIDKTKGTVSGATYTMMVLTDGTKSEIIGANREIEVKGDDKLTVKGNRSAKITGDDSVQAKNLKLKASAEAVIDASKTSIGGAGATEPAILGQAFMTWISTATFDVKGVVATLNPSALASLQKALSRKVFLK